MDNDAVLVSAAMLFGGRPTAQSFQGAPPSPFARAIFSSLQCIGQRDTFVASSIATRHTMRALDITDVFTVVNAPGAPVPHRPAARSHSPSSSAHTGYTKPPYTRRPSDPEPSSPSDSSWTHDEHPRTHTGADERPLHPYDPRKSPVIVSWPAPRADVPSPSSSPPSPPPPPPLPPTPPRTRAAPGKSRTARPESAEKPTAGSSSAPSGDAAPRKTPPTSDRDDDASSDTSRRTAKAASGRPAPVRKAATDRPSTPVAAPSETPSSATIRPEPSSRSAADDMTHRSEAQLLEKAKQRVADAWIGSDEPPDSLQVGLINEIVARELYGKKTVPENPDNVHIIYHSHDAADTNYHAINKKINISRVDGGKVFAFIVTFRNNKRHTRAIDKGTLGRNEAWLTVGQFFTYGKDGLLGQYAWKWNKGEIPALVKLLGAEAADVTAPSRDPASAESAASASPPIYNKEDLAKAHAIVAAAWEGATPLKTEGRSDAQETAFKEFIAQQLCTSNIVPRNPAIVHVRSHYNQTEDRVDWKTIEGVVEKAHEDGGNVHFIIVRRMDLDRLSILNPYDLLKGKPWLTVSQLGFAENDVRGLLAKNVMTYNWRGIKAILNALSAEKATAPSAVASTTHATRASATMDTTRATGPMAQKPTAEPRVPVDENLTRARDRVNTAWRDASMSTIANSEKHIAEFKEYIARKLCELNTISPNPANVRFLLHYDSSANRIAWEYLATVVDNAHSDGENIHLVIVNRKEVSQSHRHDPRDITKNRPWLTVSQLVHVLGEDGGFLVGDAGKYNTEDINAILKSLSAEAKMPTASRAADAKASTANTTAPVIPAPGSSASAPRTTGTVVPEPAVVPKPAVAPKPAVVPKPAVASKPVVAPPASVEEDLARARERVRLACVMANDIPGEVRIDEFQDSIARALRDNGSIPSHPADVSVQLWHNKTLGEIEHKILGDMVKDVHKKHEMVHLVVLLKHDPQGYSPAMNLSTISANRDWLTAYFMYYSDGAQKGMLTAEVEKENQTGTTNLTRALSLESDATPTTLAGATTRAADTVTIAAAGASAAASAAQVAAAAPTTVPPKAVQDDKKQPASASPAPASNDTSQSTATTTTVTSAETPAVQPTSNPHNGGSVLSTITATAASVVTTMASVLKRSPAKPAVDLTPHVYVSNLMDPTDTMCAAVQTRLVKDLQRATEITLAMGDPVLDVNAPRMSTLRVFNAGIQVRTDDIARLLEQNKPPGLLVTVFVRPRVINTVHAGMFAEFAREIVRNDNTTVIAEIEYNSENNNIVQPNAVVLTLVSYLIGRETPKTVIPAISWSSVDPVTKHKSVRIVMHPHASQQVPGSTTPLVECLRHVLAASGVPIEIVDTRDTRDIPELHICITPSSTDDVTTATLLSDASTKTKATGRRAHLTPVVAHAHARAVITRIALIRTRGATDQETKCAPVTMYGGREVPTVSCVHDDDLAIGFNDMKSRESNCINLCAIATVVCELIVPNIKEDLIFTATTTSDPKADMITDFFMYSIGASSSLNMQQRSRIGHLVGLRQTVTKAPPPHTSVWNAKARQVRQEAARQQALPQHTAVPPAQKLFKPPATGQPQSKGNAQPTAATSTTPAAAQKVAPARVPTVPRTIPTAAAAPAAVSPATTKAQPIAAQTATRLAQAAAQSAQQTATAATPPSMTFDELIKDSQNHVKVLSNKRTLPKKSPKSSKNAFLTACKVVNAEKDVKWDNIVGCLYNTLEEDNDPNFRSNSVKAVTVFLFKTEATTTDELLADIRKIQAHRTIEGPTVAIIVSTNVRTFARRTFMMETLRAYVVGIDKKSTDISYDEENAKILVDAANALFLD